MGGLRQPHSSRGPFFIDQGRNANKGTGQWGWPPRYGHQTKRYERLAAEVATEVGQGFESGCISTVDRTLPVTPFEPVQYTIPAHPAGTDKATILVSWRTDVTAVQPASCARVLDHKAATRVIEKKAEHGRSALRSVGKTHFHEIDLPLNGHGSCTAGGVNGL